VTFTLAEPDAYFLSDLASAIGYVVSPKAIATYGLDYAKHPVGTGPFAVASVDPLVLKKNPTYWRRDEGGRRLPYLDEIKMRPISEGADPLTVLRAGDVDLVQTYVDRTIADAVGDHSLEVQRATGSTAFTLVFNTRKPPFDDVRARRAVAYAIDRDALNRAVDDGAGRPADSPFAPESRYFADVDWPGYDPTKAKDLTASLDADGVDTSFTASCINTAEVRERIVPTIERQAKAVGFTVDADLIDGGPYVNVLFGGEHDFEVACFGSNQVIDGEALAAMYGTNGQTNMTGYSNPTVDRSLEDLASTTDQDERVRLLRVVQEQLAKDVPAVPLLYDLAANIHRSDVSGLPVPEATVLGAIEPATLYRRG
jgi:peptide/nickel transport system substrate-binding protein